MRIAQIAPPYESVPPKRYGGTERIVSYLTEELLAMGHDVTLFASGDSETAARLVPTSLQAVRHRSGCADDLARLALMLETVFSHAEQFDVLHFHTDCLHYPLARQTGYPTLTTMHGRLDIPILRALHDEYSEIPLVSISDAQRLPMPQANWLSTIYHGLPEDRYTFQPKPGDYLAFLGRISPEKRVDRAIEIARRSGMMLRIAAKVDDADREYFESAIRPLLAEKDIEFLGEIDEPDKEDLLAHARALLFPIDWPEPFGLVMLESIACGTPVIAYDHGSVPEVMADGVTGFITTDIASSVAAVERVGSLDRRACRDYFEQRFTARRMASDYLRAYEQLRVPVAVA